ncbi:Imm50 family immunity protein [Streptomyces sp. SAS_270]|uniref:Imm50 family immunity protein n=1 Tax=Streptomyces sp. SAS_270 TaxID=3412748 RepID=UPI00403C9714
MSVFDGLQLLVAAGDLAGLRELYDGDPPSLDSCSLFYVHLDERGDSVTLGFETERLPSKPPSEWRQKPFNMFEFHLVLVGVEALRVHGWGPAQAKEVGLVRRDGGRVDVTLGGAEDGIRFRASSVSLGRTRVYLAARGSE